MAGPFDVQTPGWLQERALMNTKWSNEAPVGEMVGTGLAAVNRMFTDKIPVKDANGETVKYANGQPMTRSPSFWEAYGNARASQQDPMWALKSKHLEAQNEALITGAKAKWMEADRKTQNSLWMQDSMDTTVGWTPKDPIPAGLHPTVATAMLKQKMEYDQVELARQKLELAEKKAAQDYELGSARVQNQGEAVAVRADQGQQKIELAEKKAAQDYELGSARVQNQGEAVAVRADQGQQKIDLDREKFESKKTEATPTPSVYTEPETGKKFLILGKNRPIELTATTAVDKAKISTITHRINVLNTQLANPDLAVDNQAKLKAQLDEAVSELSKFAVPTGGPPTNQSPVIRSGRFKVQQIP